MNDYKNTFDKICNDTNVIGANIVVCNSDEILESHSFGYQDIESNKLSSEDTVYRIASISKTCGAIGLMQLYEKGLIDLDEDISKYLGYTVRNPKYPNDKITVKMITLQTSSIQDGYDDENPEFDDIIKGYNGINGTYIDVTLEELLTDTSSKYYTPLTYGNYKPGTRFCYSNFGCGIMACIIEKVSGELYVDYMENHVFKPLGLNASFKAKRITNHDNIASMYYFHNKLIKNSPEKFINSGLPVFSLGNNFRGPAGGLFISMKDLSIIMRMFLNYGTYKNVQILKRETVEMMYACKWCGLATDEYRAKGIQMRIIDGMGKLTLRGHTGSAYGVYSYMFFSLKHQIGACFITNGINSNNRRTDVDKLFFETQKSWIEKYTTNKPTKAIIDKDKITLNERTIVQKDLIINSSNPYILGKSFSEILDTLGIYDEEKIEYRLKINGKNLIINNIIVYNDEFYINLEKTLKLLNINYTKDYNYIITF